MAKQFDIMAMAGAFTAIQTVQQQAHDALQRIAERDGKLVEAKNVKDHAKTVASDLWRDVFQVASAVYTATVDCPADREIVISAVLRQFLNVEKGAKKTTAGQYASTARSLLAHVTKYREDIADYADFNRREIMDAMRDEAHADLLAKVKEAAKSARFIIRHGDNEARWLLEELLQSVAVIHAPIKAKKEGEKAASVGQRELADLRQRHPSAPMVTETIAAIVATGGEETGNKQAVA